VCVKSIEKAFVMYDHFFTSHTNSQYTPVVHEKWSNHVRADPMEARRISFVPNNVL